MKKQFSFLVMLLLGGAFGYFFVGKVLGPSIKVYSKTGMLYLLLALPLLFLLVIGLHELGHVFLGRLNQFSLYGLTVGPFSWKPDDDGQLKFSWNTNLNVAGGLAIMLPRGDHRLRSRFMWFAAGGPLASLLLTAGGYAVGRLFPVGSTGALLADATAFFSLLIFFVTILPFRAGGFASDGMRVLSLATNSTAGRIDLVMMRLIAHLRAGRPYAELPRAELEQIAGDPKVAEQQRVSMTYYLYLQQLAAGNIEGAAASLATVIDRLEVYPDGSRGSFYAEQALFEAKYRNDLPAAEAAFANFTANPFTEALSIHLVDAAFADLRGDKKKLAESLPLIEQSLPGSIDQSRAVIIRSWLAEWRT